MSKHRTVVSMGSCFDCQKREQCFPWELIAREGLHPKEFMEHICEDYMPATGMTPLSRCRQTLIDREALARERQRYVPSR